MLLLFVFCASFICVLCFFYLCFVLLLFVLCFFYLCCHSFICVLCFFYLRCHFFICVVAVFYLCFALVGQRINVIFQTIFFSLLKQSRSFTFLFMYLGELLQYYQSSNNLPQSAQTLDFDLKSCFVLLNTSSRPARR